MLPKINPTNTQAWLLLTKHYDEMRNVIMKRLFNEDADRFKKFSLRFQDMLFDYSKNIITDKTMQFLLQLANDCKVKEAIEAMFSGDKINETENRSVLHIALRNFSDKPVMSDGKDVMPDVQKCAKTNERFLRKNSQRRMERLYRQKNKIHCKHWHWWKRSWSGDGN